MDFELSDRARDLRERLLSFVGEHVIPAEPVWAQQLLAGERELVDLVRTVGESQWSNPEIRPSSR